METTIAASVRSALMNPRALVLMALGVASVIGLAHGAGSGPACISCFHGAPQ